MYFTDIATTNRRPSSDSKGIIISFSELDCNFKSY